jgi:ribosomal protein L40E
MALRISLIILMLTVSSVGWINVAAGQENQSAVRPTIICPDCGEANPAGSQFCRQCGKDLTRQLAPVKEAAKTESPPAPTNITAPTPTEKPSVSNPPLGADQELPYQRLSDTELRRILDLLLTRMNEPGLRPTDSQRVGDMTRAELEALINKLLREAKVRPKATGFGQFLQVMGGITLGFVGLMIILAL